MFLQYENKQKKPLVGDLYIASYDLLEKLPPLVFFTHRANIAFMSLTPYNYGTVQKSFVQFCFQGARPFFCHLKKKIHVWAF